jgi:hypothetical protein
MKQSTSSKDGIRLANQKISPVSYETGSFITLQSPVCGPSAAPAESSPHRHTQFSFPLLFVMLNNPLNTLNSFVTVRNTLGAFFDERLLAQVKPPRRSITPRRLSASSIQRIRSYPSFPDTVSCIRNLKLCHAVAI